MKGYLQLESGDIYEGNWLTNHILEDVSGEIVFFTGMTGYQEVLTDPSYKDQIIVFTYPLIGNYGINEEDFESNRPHVAGVIVYEANEEASHYQAQYTLKQYLQKWNIPLLSHIDTRSVVKKIRNSGSMPALLTKSYPKEINVPKLCEDNKVSKVSTSQFETFGAGSIHIVLIDYGKKESILSSLLERNCKVTVIPYHTSFQMIRKMNPNGILLSNGPGNPKNLQSHLPTVKELITHYPTLGICLGHQLVALSLGGNTKKLLFGHRGANHPVKDEKNNIVFMSSQNHSFYVDKDSLIGTNLKGRFYNLHDQSIEGLVHDYLPIQTVQFHPEANPGPAEGAYVFDEFLNMVKENNRSNVAYA
ncbi:carbamoyl phosphate synthase small subunit [Bacillus sp. 31A1R]|uniref:Carbamoyl phosphate synthase small chain n=1 Tax=Robertmurraya mangrovi TaxID=3098077 RepID=A0ABU5IT43_9BACI|nr:carbamoyl phosphate synthase small subunit [Bacillus sp. 31A1R]MDZ5470323.1 carbamoyl phosphate synthase small subunit [Bacillus sp. 31A1R]